MPVLYTAIAAFSTLYVSITMLSFAGRRRGERDSEDWAMGGRLFHLHQLREQNKLLRRWRDCHDITPRSHHVYSWIRRQGEQVHIPLIIFAL